MTDIEKKELLNKLFVTGYYPYSKVVSGDLKKDYGIELIEICRKPFNGGLIYRYDDKNSWIGPRKPLSWGSNTGWNITEDCKIALCRVEYDDYINFEIIFLDSQSKTKLQSAVIENFWIRCYFGQGDDYFSLSISRAYRDLNRTIHGIGKIDRSIADKNYTDLSFSLKKSVINLMNFSFDTQEEYDERHQIECQILIDKFKELYGGHKIIFTIGQAQKWINMTLKYMYALGTERHKSQLDNYQFFHIPIDNIIQKQLLIDKGIPEFKVAWSRIDDYSEYLNYQKLVRQQYKNQIPMDIEFILFNK